MIELIESLLNIIKQSFDSCICCIIEDDYEVSAFIVVVQKVLMYMMKEWEFYGLYKLF
jgi:hypothetical protein